jgi:hypothetical protein
MNESYSRKDTEKKIEKRSGQSKDALVSLLRRILQTREIRQSLTSLVPLFFEAWSHNSKAKQLFSKLAGNIVKTQAGRPDDVLDKKELKALFNDETFVKNFARLLPEMVNAVIDILLNTGKCLEKASDNTKKELLQDLISKTGRGKSGELLTTLAKILTEIHQRDPRFFTDSIEPGFKNWVQSVDFAEIKESVDESGEDAIALVKMVNDVLWQYPSKVVSIVSLLPSLVNISIGSLECFIDKFNGLPPDLLTDIVTSLLKEIDDDKLAVIIDQLSEFGRKIHIGSKLLGEPGLPHFEASMALKIEAIVSKIDPEIFWKGKLALASLKADFTDTMIEAVSNDPDFLQLSMVNSSKISNIRLKSKNQHLASLDTLDDQELAGVLKSKLTTLDIEEAAENINYLIRIINRLWDQDPLILTKFVRPFLNSLDENELAFTATRFFEEIGEDLKPVARSFVPGMVEWVCDVLAPADDEYEDQARQARKALNSILKP